MLQSLSILSPALPFPALSSQLLKKNFIFQPRCWRQANKQTISIKLQLLCTPQERGRCPMSICRFVQGSSKFVKHVLSQSFESGLPTKSTKQSCCSIICYCCMSSSIRICFNWFCQQHHHHFFSSAILNAPSSACEMCVCVRAFVRACVSLSVSGFVSHRLYCS